MATQGLRPQVHLVEGSEALRSLQADALAGARFHETVDTLPDHAPMLLVANEFFDALPVRQLVCTEAGWRERMIALDKKAQFVFVAGDNPMDEALPADRKTAPPGTIIETSPAAAALAGEIARRLDVQGGAAVFIDYGHLEPRTGSTLQAVRVHEKVGLFDAPGDMDLTAHVDFAMLGQIAARAGLASATATQGEWLSALGIGQRAQALTARSPERAQDIAQAHDRLVGTDEMGDLFKVMALSPPDWPRGMGFAEGDTE
jgi:NADH dehydrogenase [ubiquinone] 1 alpha subcomplex assembly factor 7